MALQINTASFPQFTDLIQRTVTRAYENFPHIIKNSGLVKVDNKQNNDGLFIRYYEMPVIDTYAYKKRE
jgi:hypothetical protein